MEKYITKYNPRYLDLDSTYRNRNQFINEYSYESPYTLYNQTSGLYYDPILYSAPYTGSVLKTPGQLVTQTSTSTSQITLDPTETKIDNYYINSSFQIGEQFSTVTAYNGTTKVVTINPPLEFIPVAGTVYFIRKVPSYFNSDVSLGTVDPVTNTVTQLNLLNVNSSTVFQFYKGSYIRFTNGAHENTIAYIENYAPGVNAIAFSQPSNFGSVSMLSNTEEGFVFSPNVTGGLYRLTLTFTAFDASNPTRSITIKLRSGNNISGAILDTQTFSIINTFSPTQTTFIFTAAPDILMGQYYTITLTDAGTINTGFINVFGISSSGNTYNMNTFPQVKIDVIPEGSSDWSQVNSSILPLDNISTSSAQIAFSLRKLTSVYSGNCIRVLRDSDNTQQDIGFLNNGQLDIPSLMTFVNGSNGFVTVWYDQSGNTNNAIQNTLGHQPSIVRSGIIETINNVPQIYFNGSSSLVMSTYPFVNKGSCVINVVANNLVNVANANYFDFGTNTNLFLSAGPYNGTNMAFSIDNGGSTQTVTATSPSNNFLTVLSFVHEGTIMSIIQDQTQIGTTLVSENPSQVSGNNNLIGMSQASIGINAMYGELIGLALNPTSQDLLSLEIDQKRYYNTT